MRKFFLISITMAILAGCSGETTKPQSAQQKPEQKPPSTSDNVTNNNSLPKDNGQRVSKEDNSNKIKPLLPDNSPELRDLAWETIMSMPDSELTEQDFINSQLLKETKPIPQRFAPDTLEIEKNSFWSDCFPPRFVDTFENIAKNTICYPYIITRYGSGSIHSDPQFSSPISFSCLDIDSGELLWTKDDIIDLKFDPLSKKLIAKLGSIKTACIDPSNGNVLWEGNFSYLESDGERYFLAEQNFAEDYGKKDSTDRKNIIIGDINTGKILNDHLLNVAADINDKASYFDLYRFFNGKPTLKDSQGNNLDWNWKNRIYLTIDRNEKIIGDHLLLPYRTEDRGSISTCLDCYNIDTGEKIWGFSVDSEVGTMIKDPDLYFVGNKILMTFLDFGTPYTCSYLFDLDGNRYQLPSNFRIDEHNTLKHIGPILTGVNEKYQGSYGLDVFKNQKVILKPYDFALGGRLYIAKQSLSQSNSLTLSESWLKKDIFDDYSWFLDALETEKWVMVLTLDNMNINGGKSQIKLKIYDINSGENIDEISFGFAKNDSNWATLFGSKARLSIFNSKIIIQTRIGVYILSSRNNSIIKTSDNLILDDQPEPPKRVKGSDPNYSDPITKLFTISNLSNQVIKIKIIVPRESGSVSFTKTEFELKPGELKEVAHEINKIDGMFSTNSICPVLIKYGNRIESVIIITALRGYPD